MNKFRRRSQTGIRARHYTTVSEPKAAAEAAVVKDARDRATAESTVPPKKPRPPWKPAMPREMKLAHLASEIERDR